MIEVENSERQLICHSRFESVASFSQDQKQPNAIIIPGNRDQ